MKGYLQNCKKTTAISEQISLNNALSARWIQSVICKKLT